MANCEYDNILISWFWWCCYRPSIVWVYYIILYSWERNSSQYFFFSKTTMTWMTFCSVCIPDTLRIGVNSFICSSQGCTSDFCEERYILGFPINKIFYGAVPYNTSHKNKHTFALITAKLLPHVWFLCCSKESVLRTNAHTSVQKTNISKFANVTISFGFLWAKTNVSQVEDSYSFQDIKVKSSKSWGGNICTGR